MLHAKQTVCAYQRIRYLQDGGEAWWWDTPIPMKRGHASIDDKTPDQAYWQLLPDLKMAA
jgi:hypothetical protein